MAAAKKRGKRPDEDAKARAKKAAEGPSGSKGSMKDYAASRGKNKKMATKREK
jgi:hypothetical protein